MRWTCYKGWHWSNQVYSGFFLFEIGGKRIVHSGDNTRWLAFSRLEASHHLDLFLFKPECLRDDEAPDRTALERWAEVVQRMSPKRVVPHHMIEIGHGLGAYSHQVCRLTRDLTPLEIPVSPLLEGENLWI